MPLIFLHIASEVSKFHRPRGSQRLPLAREAEEDLQSRRLCNALRKVEVVTGCRNASKEGHQHCTVGCASDGAQSPRFPDTSAKKRRLMETRLLRNLEQLTTKLQLENARKPTVGFLRQVCWKTFLLCSPNGQAPAAEAYAVETESNQGNGPRFWNLASVGAKDGKGQFGVHKGIWPQNAVKVG